jgi:hypothetical protein
VDPENRAQNRRPTPSRSAQPLCDPVIDHVERVAAAVPADARPTALLHDLLERCATARWQLRRTDLTRPELEALELLRHAGGEPHKVYVRRIAVAPGPAGRLAQLVKLVLSASFEKESDATPTEGTLTLCIDDEKVGRR